ncbi:MAG: DUF1080 domain-containing protein [Propionibacteriaceae bacterium]|jgi:hypothetical protein|nr:DUF1080 domain-containing protein [Propionibacteriaceae bacterium]
MPRSLFDGKTLAGWHSIPRLSTPLWPGGPHPDGQPDIERAQLTSGKWEVDDAAIVGSQEITGYGGYLLSDEEFGDFELSFEIRPDWPADTGVVLRSTKRGSQGYQLLIDHRKSGAIGGFYGNGIGAFHASAFNLDVATDDQGRQTGLRIEDAQTTLEPVTPEQRAQLGHAIDGAKFLKIWRFGDWNHFRVRCVGELPRLTSWINGTLAFELDTATMDFPNWHPQAVLALLGAKGHIALEVHDNEWPGMGPARWAPGAVSRWRNIEIEEL